MATGRTHPRWTRVYVSGNDVSGYARKIGPLATEYDAVDVTTLSDSAKGYLPGQASVKCGTLSAVLDNDAAGLHALAKASAGTKRIVTTCIGIRAAPAMGDPCFTAEAAQLGYGATDDGGAATVDVPLGEWAGNAASLLYGKGWGWVLNPGTAAITAANTAAGIDDLISPAVSTARGGYLVYHVLAGDGGTITLKAQDSAAANTDVNFADITGATSGVINATAGTSGIVAIAPTATVRRWLRWQAALGTALTCTAVVCFVRG